MITTDEFNKIVTAYKEFCDRLNTLADLGVDLYDGPISNATDTLFENWVDSILTDEGGDIIYWWMFDDVEKKIYNKEGDVENDVEDITDLYDYLLFNKYFK